MYQLERHQDIIESRRPAALDQYSRRGVCVQVHAAAGRQARRSPLTMFRGMHSIYRRSSSLRWTTAYAPWSQVTNLVPFHIQPCSACSINIRGLLPSYGARPSLMLPFFASGWLASEGAQPTGASRISFAELILRMEAVGLMVDHQIELPLTTDRYW